MRLPCSPAVPACSAAGARHAAASRIASTGDSATSARTAAAKASASTGGVVAGARTAAVAAAQPLRARAAAQTSCGVCKVRECVCQPGGAELTRPLAGPGSTRGRASLYPRVAR
eukprot:scaffold62765_cov27-Phaeocystis_antarctica.AAC.1